MYPYYLRPKGRGRKLVRGCQGVRHGSGRMGKQRQWYIRRWDVYLIWCAVEDEEVQGEAGLRLWYRYFLNAIWSIQAGTAAFQDKFEASNLVPLLLHPNLVPLLSQRNLKHLIWHCYFCNTFGATTFSTQVWSVQFGTTIFATQLSNNQFGTATFSRQCWSNFSTQFWSIQIGTAKMSRNYQFGTTTFSTQFEASHLVPHFCNTFGTATCDFLKTSLKHPIWYFCITSWYHYFLNAIWSIQVGTATSSRHIWSI